MAKFDVKKATEKELLAKKEQMERWIESFKPQARTMTLEQMNKKLKEYEKIIKYLDEEIAEYEHEIEGARDYIAEGYGDDDDERELKNMEIRLPEMEEELKECQDEVRDLRIASTQRGKYHAASRLIEKIENRLTVLVSRRLAKEEWDRIQRDKARKIKDEVPRNTHCPYCFEELDYNSDDVHLDHILPISRHGETKVENLVYCCKSCNLKKGDKKVKTFIRENKLNRFFVLWYLELLGKEIDSKATISVNSPEPRRRRRIYSSEPETRWEYFQPNERDVKDRENDCIIRALCKFLDLKWSQVFFLMALYCLKKQYMISDIETLDEVLKIMGCSYSEVFDNPTLGEILRRSEVGKGEYLFNLADPESEEGTGHVVTVDKAVIYDTWNCEKWKVIGYWTKGKNFSISKLYEYLGIIQSEGRSTMLVEYLDDLDLEFVDKRDKGGALWIIDNSEDCSEKIDILRQKFDAVFHYKKGGGRSTDWRPAWWTTCDA